MGFNLHYSKKSLSLHSIERVVKIDHYPMETENMLSGVKFISREEMGKQDKNSTSGRKNKKNNKWYSSDDYSSSSESDNDRNKKKGRSGKTKKKKSRKHYTSDVDDDRLCKGSMRKKDASVLSDDERGRRRRKEMGLDWMLTPTQPTKMEAEDQPSRIEQEVKKPNPRELNPYFKNDGSGYPEEATIHLQDQESPVVGDGGASWRLKALKRAQEQAAREGRKLNEVVEERWGSVGQLAVSAASRSLAPSRAHLHAIRSRQKDDMRAPIVHDNLSWKKQKMPSKEEGVISAAMATLNQFSNDGTFLHQVQNQNEKVDGSDKSKPEWVSSESNIASEEIPLVKEGLSANQLAAKAMQLRMKGKHEEAETLMQEAERMKAKEQSSIRPRNEGRLGEQKREDNADVHLARNIVQNKQYSMSGRADDEYDYEDGPTKKSCKKGGDSDHNISQRSSLATHVIQHCLSCFENPKRPKHLVVSIANFTYLMLPQWQAVVPGHCCIMTTQHESCTRTVDDNVWDEIRNFKKCLIMMFAKQEKKLVFLETVMGLAQQRRHCMVECIPLPQDIAEEAPLYFKKAIDEAEDEWSQHNAKKLIDTSGEKGKDLRRSIPKDFPYFHVEFGLKKGFVHVIDDEAQFKSNLGLNVIRGMLRLEEQDMYRRQKLESVATQKEAVINFAREWEPFDWTKQLDN